MPVKCRAGAETIAIAPRVDLQCCAVRRSRGPSRSVYPIRGRRPLGGGAFGLQLIVVNARTDSDLETAFATFSQQRVGAVLASSSAFYSNRTEQVDSTLTAQRRRTRAANEPSRGSDRGHNQRCVAASKRAVGRTRDSSPAAWPKRTTLVISQPVRGSGATRAPTLTSMPRRLRSPIDPR